MLKEEHNILIGRKMGLREYNQVQATAWSAVSGNLAALACNLHPACFAVLKILSQAELASACSQGTAPGAR